MISAVTSRATLTVVLPTPVQRAAMFYYNVGLNPMPVLTPQEVRAQPGADPNETKKPPYLLSDFFYARMYDERYKPVSSNRHLPEDQTFLSLFENCNVGLMTGWISQNLTIFDCDSSEAFQRVVSEFRSRKILFWAWTTHNGRGHVAIRLAEGEAENNKESKIKDVNIIGRRAYASCPPSVHWSGEFYTWLDDIEPDGPPPIVSITALDFIGVKLYKKSRFGKPDMTGFPEWTVFLADPNQCTLISPPQKEGARNIILTDLIYDAVGVYNYGYIDDRNEMVEILIDCGERCRPQYKKSQVLSMIKSAQNKEPRATPTRNLAQKDKTITPLWKVAVYFAQDRTWIGRTAQTDRDVFLALCERAKLDGRELFRASWLELIELANISSLHTIQKALQRLIDFDLITYVSKDKMTGAKLYKFTKQVVSYRNTIEKEPRIEKCISTVQGVIIMHSSIKTHLTQQEQDVFKSLGRVAYRAFEYLKQNPGTIMDVSKALKIHYSSVFRAMKSLAGHEMIKLNTADGLYYPESVTDETLVQVATKLGTAGASANRKADNVRMRQIHLNRKLSIARRESWLRQIR